MGKKIVEVGAPAYMAQYTSLMTILLAFFILLNTMATEQESGFKAGIGDVKNAFGMEGGLGLFQFTFAGKGASYAPNPEKSGDEYKGLHKNLAEREGGSGNTSVDTQDKKLPKYLRIKIPGEFSGKSSRLPAVTKTFLDQVGMGFALFDYKINIVCYSGRRSWALVAQLPGESKSEAIERMNRTVAFNRAVQIMRYLNRKNGVDYSRMEADACTYRRYLDRTGADDKDEKEEKDDNALSKKQEAFFYIFLKPSKVQEFNN
jgi:hypothetical protein